MRASQRQDWCMDRMDDMLGYMQQGLAEIRAASSKQNMQSPQTVQNTETGIKRTYTQADIDNIAAKQAQQQAQEQDDHEDVFNGITTCGSARLRRWSRRRRRRRRRRTPRWRVSKNAPRRVSTRSLKDNEYQSFSFLRL